MRLVRASSVTGALPSSQAEAWVRSALSVNSTLLKVPAAPLVDRLRAPSLLLRLAKLIDLPVGLTTFRLVMPLVFQPMSPALFHGPRAAPSVMLPASVMLTAAARTYRSPSRLAGLARVMLPAPETPLLSKASSLTLLPARLPADQAPAAPTSLMASPLPLALAYTITLLGRLLVRPEAASTCRGPKLLPTLFRMTE